MLFCIIIKLLLLCQTAKKFLKAYFQFLYLAHHRLIRHRSPSTDLFFVAVVQSLSRVGLSVTPRTAAVRSSVFHCLLEFAQIYVH